MNLAKSEFKRQGYHLAKGFFDKRLIDEIVTEAQTPFLIQCRELGINADDPERAMRELFLADHDRFLGSARLAQHGIRLHRLAASAPVYDALSALDMANPFFCMKPILFFNHPNLAKEEFHHKSPVHQDWRSMQGSLDAIVVWVALTDISVEMGALEIVPGSHLRGLYPTVDDSWYQHIESPEITESSYVSVPVEKGDALFFSSFLVHRSGNNVSDRVRWSTHFRYNNAEESTFIGRKFPNPYIIYRPGKELLHPGFPTLDVLSKTYEQ